MSDKKIAELLAKSSFSFVGTVTEVGASTVADLPVNNKTIIVNVDSVLHAPGVLSGFGGNRITVQLLSKGSALEVGDTVTLFTEPTVFGDSLAVDEVGRMKPTAVSKRMGMAAGTVGATPFGDITESVERSRLIAHAQEAACVVTGRVVDLKKQGKPSIAEHDPDWWVATIDVAHAENDAVSGTIKVLYANSLDVRWRSHPKPKAGQEATFICHPADTSIAKGAPYVLADSDDIQPIQFVDTLRAEG
jgi:hypothetical protein